MTLSDLKNVVSIYKCKNKYQLYAVLVGNNANVVQCSTERIKST